MAKIKIPPKKRIIRKKKIMPKKIWGIVKGTYKMPGSNTIVFESYNSPATLKKRGNKTISFVATRKGSNGKTIYVYENPKKQ